MLDAIAATRLQESIVDVIHNSAKSNVALNKFLGNSRTSLVISHPIVSRLEGSGINSSGNPFLNLTTKGSLPS